MRRFEPVRWHELTALYGGTFDPPHLGHRIAVAGLFAEPGVKRVLILPSAQPPLKVATASVSDRVAMVRLAFAPDADHPLPGDVEVDLHEIDRASKGGPASYTYDTLQEFRAKIGPGLAFVIGTDQLLDLPSWHRFPEILGVSHWIALERKPSGADQAARALSDLSGGGWLKPDSSSGASIQSWRTPQGTCLRVVPTDAPDISSTAIREGIARAGQAPAGALLPGVASYLKLHRLYGTGVS